MWANCHRFPCDHLPRILVKYIVLEEANILSFYPNNNGVSNHYITRMILHKENLDYKRHCKFAIGEYFMGHDKPSPMNTNSATTFNCLYMRPLINAQGGHKLLHLKKNTVVKQGCCTPVPVTTSVIKQVHHISAQDGMPKGLNITNHTNVVLFDLS